jgi:hypothetical protein
MFAAAAGRRGSVPPRYIFSIERRSGAYRPGNIPVLAQHAWNTSSVLFLDRVGTDDMEGFVLTPEVHLGCSRCCMPYFSIPRGQNCSGYIMINNHTRLYELLLSESNRGDGRPHHASLSSG